MYIYWGVYTYDSFHSVTWSMPGRRTMLAHILCYLSYICESEVLLEVTLLQVEVEHATKRLLFI